jgi:hypothetical protein
MVNRVMEAKSLKLVRQLRRLPKPLPDTTPALYADPRVRPIPKAYSAESVSAPRQPNAELMKGYQHRAASLAREPKGPINLTQEASRYEVLCHLKRMKEFEADHLSFTLLNTRVHRARVFFNPQKTVYILLYENYKEGTVKSSFPHADKKELVDRFRCRQLLWVEYIPRVSSG